MTKKELLDLYEEQKKVYIEKEKPQKEKDILEKYGDNLGCLLISLCFSNLNEEDKLKLISYLDLELNFDNVNLS